MFPLFCHQQLLNSFQSPVWAVYSWAGPTGEWGLTTELMSVEEPEHASAEAPKILEVLSPAQAFITVMHFLMVLLQSRQN